MYYRIGLDLGITSVGAAVISTDSEGNPKKIEGLYSRVFDACEVAKTGESLAKAKREARGSRRRLRRRRQRLDDVITLLRAHGVEYVPMVNVGFLRAQALHELISEEELGAIIYTLVKHRGFQSNKKNPENTSDKDEGKLLSAAKENSANLAKSGYATIGEYIYHSCLRERNGVEYLESRNKGDYTHTVYRKDLEDELRAIFKAQSKLGNALASEEVELALLGEGNVKGIFNRQRNFDEGPTFDESSKYHYLATFKIGKCSLEPEEERAAKCSYSVTMFDLWQKINNIVLRRIDGEDRTLTPEEKELIISKFHASSSKEVNCNQIRKWLKLDDDIRFNIVNYARVNAKDGEKPTDEEIAKAIESSEKSTKIISAKQYAEIVKALVKANIEQDGALIDEIATILVKNKSVEKRTAELRIGKYTSSLSDDAIKNLLDISASKVSHISLKAIDKILPHLMEGKKYSEAVEMAGYHDKKSDKTVLLEMNANDRKIGALVDDITSPVVKRTVTQTLKVLNAIIRKYGSPLAINIELARDMSKSKSDRTAIERDIASKTKTNDAWREEFRARYNRMPSRDEFEKYRLYIEQGGKCMYSGKHIDMDEMFVTNTNLCQVDHIVPFSKCFNNSLTNKVLVLTAENQRKGNRLPFEYMSEEQFEQFRVRVLGTYKGNPKKIRNLLATKVNDEEMKSRALNDTRYIARFMRSLIEDNLIFEPGKMSKKRVFAVNGGMTATLRHIWHIGKVREDGDIHHAVDAAVIACATDSAIKAVSDYCAGEANKYSGASSDYYVRMKAVEPYEGFSDELKARCLPTKESMADRLRAVGYSEDEVESVEPIFVSHMPRRKVKGAIHKDTIYRVKDEEIIDKKGEISTRQVKIVKTALESLTFKKKSDGSYYIEGFYRPEQNERLYNALIDRYVDCGCDTKKAFAEPFYKPCDSGKGPIVRSVPIVSTTNSALAIGKTQDKKRGYADNGDMVRVDIFAKPKTDKKGNIRRYPETGAPMLEYYGVPVYTADVYAGVLPMRASQAAKQYDEWPIMTKEYEFLFSLYPDDLIYVEKKVDGDIHGKLLLEKVRNNANSVLDDTRYCRYVYYSSFHRGAGAINVEDHTRAYSLEGLGIKSLVTMKKCTVDVLGNISFVAHETRQPIGISDTRRKK